MVCHLFNVKPLSEPVLLYSWTIANKFESKFYDFHLRKYISKCCLQNGSYFVLASIWYIVKHLLNVNLGDNEGYKADQLVEGH